MSEDTLFTTFNLPDCISIKWDAEKPTCIDYDDKGHNNWRIPPIPICSFQFDHHNVGFYGEFDDQTYLLRPFIYVPTFMATSDTDFLTVAQAIGELRAFQYSEWLLEQPLEDAVECLSVPTIAAYRVCPNLRSSFPRLDQFINQKTKNGGFIYLLSDQQGHYKIGHTKDLDKRIYQLGTQPPFEIKLLDSCWVPDRQRVERWLHEINKEFRMRGEWFKFDESELEKVRNWFDAVFVGNSRVPEAYAETDWSNWREIARRRLAGWPYEDEDVPTTIGSQEDDEIEALHALYQQESAPDVGIEIELITAGA